MAMVVSQAQMLGRTVAEEFKKRDRLIVDLLRILGKDHPELLLKHHEYISKTDLYKLTDKEDENEYQE